MAEATISSKNQIVVPKEVRQALGVKAGDKLLIMVRGGNRSNDAKAQGSSKSINGYRARPLWKGLLAQGAGELGLNQLKVSHPPQTCCD